MISNFRYWGFVLILASSYAIYSWVSEPFRIIVVFVTSFIFSLMFNKFRKRLVEVNRR